MDFGSREAARPSQARSPIGIFGSSSAPKTLAITVTGASVDVSPSGSSIHRAGAAQIGVTEPSWVQWPVLCERIASSLTAISSAPDSFRKCKKLYREHTSYAQLGGNLFTQCLSALLQLRGRSRGWRDSFSAHTVALHSSVADQRVATSPEVARPARARGPAQPSLQPSKPPRRKVRDRSSPAQIHYSETTRLCRRSHRGAPSGRPARTSGPKIVRILGRFNRRKARHRCAQLGEGARA